MRTRKLIIDTDPGIDDAAAIAILLSDPSLDVKLIASVSGNVGIEHTTNNALKLMTFFNKDIPVAKGAAMPLMRGNIFATNAHGKSGMGGFEFPEPNLELLLKENAVMSEYHTIMALEEKVTILTIGPLTNIALLISTFPEVKEKIEEIIMMGGSTERGNIGVYSEFNVNVDPEAAKIVFRSGIPITMLGLDIGRKARLTAGDLDELDNCGKAGKMISSLFRSYDGGNIEEGVKMYDPSAAMYLLEPELFKVKEAYVDVEICSPLTSGATVVDFDGILNKEKNTTVCIDVNVDKFRENYIKRVREIQC
ncbi:ribonucleoside hydrolase RihC [Clostridium sartagoforme]|uniref:Ribonucleoside hydrolase RihC n=1 Tax=Clostridium sartagoforme TaxID=84031 RepID=A0A4S2DMR3_9CLOT|nr:MULTISPECIES: ribonucleoside hydrolase RihC [Clostridium]MBS5937877.1 ribonucleoside hydrolase RihC [Clostridium sp.]TGY42324.1 ribonucleoside hydrolase RihC [Clostridium sartagoforme]